MKFRNQLVIKLTILQFGGTADNWKRSDQKTLILTIWCELSKVATATLFSAPEASRVPSQFHDSVNGRGTYKTRMSTE